VELVVALGKEGRDIPAAEAVGHVFGYGVGLDLTRRDLQNEAKKLGRPWEIGKAFDQSAPIGPITPITQSGELASGPIQLRVNGVTRQSSDIGKLIWSVAEIIAHLSAAWALAPGDLIMTGTPEGVAAVARGDRLEAECVGCIPIEVIVS
ncbi:MAG: fumarylacetoacetate hydrolase family protein, partial [Casimicrobiaceae bacterium]